MQPQSLCGTRMRQSQKFAVEQSAFPGLALDQLTALNTGEPSLASQFSASTP
jgi:hypothetical protein